MREGNQKFKKKKKPSCEKLIMKLSELGANNFKFSSENHVSPILFLLAIPTQLTKDKKNF